MRQRLVFTVSVEAIPGAGAEVGSPPLKKTMNASFALSTSGKPQKKKMLPTLEGQPDQSMRNSAWWLAQGAKLFKATSIFFLKIAKLD